MKKLMKYWYILLAAGFIISAAGVFIVFGEGSFIAVHDNLDLFIAQFQMMKDTGTFFSQGANVPFLGGVSRDNLPSEFSLYTMMFMVLPSYWAYITGYIIKIFIAIASCILLARDFYEENYIKYRPIVVVMGLAYGILNLFPAFGIPFASIPLVIYLLRRIYKKPSFKWYVFLFLYPILSYFSYFGLFILAYLAVAVIWLWMKDRRFPKALILALFILSAGYIVFEYRLFALMLLGTEETIRVSMESGNLTGSEIMYSIWEVFSGGMFHAESVHTYFVMPVCGVYFVYLNLNYIKTKNYKGIGRDLFNLCMLILVFNSVIYGIYFWEDFRTVIEKLIPPLKGWQFNRTIFFSPFIWYAAFFLVLKRLYDNDKALYRVAANVLAVAAVLIIVFTGTRYNDFYHTSVEKAYEILKGKIPDQLNYREFYSEELFNQAKEATGYSGEWAAAYGFHPATLEYNGIATLDGYLGFYSQSYKERFRSVIAPAIDRVEESRIYFDTWGARAYLFSGTEVSIVNASRTYVPADKDIYIDIEAFKALGGSFIYSRIELSNAEEAGLMLLGTFSNPKSPYLLYVYKAA